MDPTNTSERRLRALGQAIRAARRGAGLSQEELAEMSGLHTTFISRIENGRVNLTFDSMARIARALNCRIWAFFIEAGL